MTDTLSDTRNKKRDAWFEIEHISGLNESLQRTHERFAELKHKQGLDRVDALRQAVEATRDEHEMTIARINRWWLAWDRACGKLVRAFAAGLDNKAKSILRR